MSVPKRLASMNSLPTPKPPGPSGNPPEYRPVRDLQKENARLAAELARVKAGAAKLREALSGILSDPHDSCPMCDFGKLRNPEKSHWPECQYAKARAVIAYSDERLWLETRSDLERVKLQMAAMRQALRPLVFFAEDYLRGTAHPGVSRLVTDAKAALAPDASADMLTREQIAIRAAEMLWIVLANVSGGDWTKQTEEWQVAARRWADNFHKVAAELGAKVA